MATRARKDRKRAGIKFTKAAKVPTPFEERSAVVGLVRGPESTKHAGRIQPRSAKKVALMYEARGLEVPGGDE